MFSQRSNFSFDLKDLSEFGQEYKYVVNFIKMMNLDLPDKPSQKFGQRILEIVSKFKQFIPAVRQKDGTQN
jgi:hypothetical protein